MPASSMYVVPLGVGNAFSARFYSSCLAIQAEGSWLLVDCPHPVRKMLTEAQVSAELPSDIDQFSAVVLTHLHGDHASGLEMFGFYYRYALEGRRAKLLTHPEVAERLWQGHLAGSMEWSLAAPGQPPRQRKLEDFFDLEFLSESSPAQVGPFSIHCRRTIHSIPTTALKIQAGGRKLGYSADTAFDPELIAWLAEADLILHETGVGTFHTDYDCLAELPADLRARMRLIHYGDDFESSRSCIEPVVQGHSYAV